MKQLTIFQTVAGVLLCSALSTFAQTVSTPTFTANGGNFVTSTSVQITSATSGSTIYYTTDGTTPTGSSSSIASGSSISVTSTSRIKAFARRSGMTDSSLATSQPYYHYSVTGNQHYFYGNWPDPFYDDKMNVIRADQVNFSGTQHFNFYTNTVIETKGARSGLRVLSNWKFHGNGATLKLSANTPTAGGESFINTCVIGVASAGASVSDEVDNVLVDGFSINCNYDDLNAIGSGNAMLRGIGLVGTGNEVRNCTVRQPSGRHPSGLNSSEVFAIDLRAHYKNSWGNVVSNCVVMDYKGGASSWVNGIAISGNGAGGYSNTATVRNCKVYGNGNGTDYGYNAQGPVTVTFYQNESHDMNRGFNNDTGDGSNIEWSDSVFNVPANARGMYIRASQDGVAMFNTFNLNGNNAEGIVLGGPWTPQLGARDWLFDLNVIQRTAAYTGCWGFAFGTTDPPPPSYITLTDNVIDAGVNNRITGGTGNVFSGNRTPANGTPQGF